MAIAKKPVPYRVIKFKTIDEYHNLANDIVINKLNEMKAIIKKAAPNATEVISYNMPAFKQNKILVYYAAYKNHIGFYPTPQPIKEFAAELLNYKTSKGAIQFELSKALPKKLIQKIVRYRIQQDAIASKTIMKK